MLNREVENPALCCLQSISVGRMSNSQLPMNALSQTTIRRLKKLPQIPSVWEGDRRSLAGFHGRGTVEAGNEGDCAIWVDGTEGFVRAMDIIAPDVGPEAMVRALLRAMETPHSPAQPGRPQKIVVCNREIQFFLRGALQDLDIAIDYNSQLPLIDELFRSFAEMGKGRPPELPPAYEAPLEKSAAAIWQAAPWNLLADSDIIAIEFDGAEVGTLYACVMGMLGQEYGIILYRSLDSLKQFRAAAVSEKSREQLEQAFLSQDCWFLNYEAADDEWEDEDIDLADLPDSEIVPLFGSVHLYEGIRPFLDEEEARCLYVALEAFLRFFRASERALDRDEIGSLSKRYRLPWHPDAPETVTVKVSTQPELATELLSMSGFPMEDSSSPSFSLSLRDDLVPDKSFLSLGVIPWEMLEQLRCQPQTYYQSQGATVQGEGMPVILIQTSRPKAKEMIDALQAAGGLKAICFNAGEDSMTGTTYDLGILQAGNGNLYICGEFLDDDTEHVQARRKWDRRCQQTKGYCGLLVAKGVTGATRGKPKPQDMMAFFETRAVDSKDLAMGVLQLLPHRD